MTKKTKQKTENRKQKLNVRFLLSQFLFWSSGASSLVIFPSHSSLGFRHFPWFRHSVAPGKFCNAPTRSGQLLPVTGGVKDFIPAKAALLAGGTTVAPQSST
jgi:hypothetical protein